MAERPILVEAEADGTPIRERYVPDGGTTIWERTYTDGQVVTNVDTGQPAPVDPVDPVAELVAQLPATTLEETNDLLAQIVALLGGA